LARRPHDRSHQPRLLGAWFPHSIPTFWPFCWFVAVVEDHFSRRVMGVAVFKKEPTSKAIQVFLDGAIRAAGRAPRHLISDRGSQFIDGGFAHWCQRHGIGHRFGAVGKYGSIAVIERLMRTFKTEFTRRLVLVSFRRSEFARELSLWSRWYNAHRPHEVLVAPTPDEVYFRRRPACRAPRNEPRPRWPRGCRVRDRMLWSVDALASTSISTCVLSLAGSTYRSSHSNEPRSSPPSFLFGVQCD
jgi:transposase InsO family protein